MNFVTAVAVNRADAAVRLSGPRCHDDCGHLAMVQAPVLGLGQDYPMRRRRRKGRSFQCQSSNRFYAVHWIWISQQDFSVEIGDVDSLVHHIHQRSCHWSLHVS